MNEVGDSTSFTSNNHPGKVLSRLFSLTHERMWRFQAGAAVAAVDAVDAIVAAYLLS